MNATTDPCQRASSERNPLWRVGGSERVQPSFELASFKRSWLRDQRTRRLNQPPGVPQQHTAHVAARHIIDSALTKLFAPIAHHVAARVQFTNGFVAPIEQVGVKEWQV